MIRRAALLLASLALVLSGGCETPAHAGFTIATGTLTGGITSPLQLSGCLCWLRSDLGITNSSGVSAWANQGTAGSACDAAQSTAGLRPAYASSGGQNNRATVTFDGTDRLDWAADVFDAKTWLIVVKLAATPGTGFTIYETFHIGVVAEMIVDLTTYQPTSFIDNYASGGLNMVGTADALGSATTRYLLHTYNDVDPNTPSSYTATLDGAAKTVVASSVYGSTAASSHIGSRHDNSFPLNGIIYEIIIYNRVLNSLEQAQLNLYAKNYYGL